MRLSILSENTCNQLQAQGYRFLKFIHSATNNGKEFALYQPVKHKSRGSFYQPIAVPADTDQNHRTYICE